MKENNEVEFIPGDLVWLVCVYNASCENYGLVMCLEEDFPIQTFLKGSEVVTIVCSSTNKLFSTQQTCDSFIKEFEQEAYMCKKRTTDIMMKAINDMKDQSQ